MALTECFTSLFLQYPGVLAQMPRVFTSHEFILRLAQENQGLYTEALSTYREADAPFRIVHSILARHLRAYREAVQCIGLVPSPDIFGNPNRCAQWQKVIPEAEPAPTRTLMLL